MIELAIVAGLCLASFVGGLLVGRKHPAGVETAVAVAKTVAADAQAVADVAKKV